MAENIQSKVIYRTDIELQNKNEGMETLKYFSKLIKF